MMTSERSRTGVWRIPLWSGFAVGIDFYRPCLCQFTNRSRFGLPGWSLRIFWFHVGRAPRKTWR